MDLKQHCFLLSTLFKSQHYGFYIQYIHSRTHGQHVPKRNNLMGKWPQGKTTLDI